jgi:putative peptidoglycan lipid II flippase
VAGSAAQFLVQLPVVLKLVPHLKIRLETGIESVQIILRNFGPVFVSRGVVQLSGYIDSMLASLLGTGAVSSMRYATNISMLPVSLFGMSISASELPEMSREASGEALRTRLLGGLRRIAFLVVPSVVAFVALGDVIAAAIYQSGAFGHPEAVYVWFILAGSGIGLLASTQSRLYSSAFYALKDTRTPLRFAVIRIILTTALGYFFARPFPAMLGLDARWGAAGLTASAGISGWVEFALLRNALSRRIGEARVNVAYMARLWGAAIAAAAIAWAIKLKLPPMHPIVAAVVILAPFGGIYLGLAGWRNLSRR